MISFPQKLSNEQYKKTVDTGYVDIYTNNSTQYVYMNKEGYESFVYVVNEIELLFEIPNCKNNIFNILEELIEFKHYILSCVRNICSDVALKLSVCERTCIFSEDFYSIDNLVVAIYENVDFSYIMSVIDIPHKKKNKYISFIQRILIDGDTYNRLIILLNIIYSNNGVVVERNDYDSLSASSCHDTIESLLDELTKSHYDIECWSSDDSVFVE